MIPVAFFQAWSQHAPWPDLRQVERDLIICRALCDLFKFTPEADPQTTLGLKEEISTREHANLLSIRRYPFSVASDWYEGEAEVASYEPEELLGTKLLALLQ